MDVEAIAAQLGAVSADIPGIWWLDGYPELTSAQLVAVHAARYNGTISIRDAAQHLIEKGEG